MQARDRIAERFEIEKLAGRGGIGEVYRAHDHRTGEKVAVKVLRRQDPEEADRLMKEAWVLSELRHAGIVRYIDHGQTPGGEPYLAMEWLSGEKLSTRIARGKLSVEESLRLGARLAEALAAAHARGVVHRDIKPQNLFLVKNSVEHAKILDFGIARLGRAMRALRKDTPDEIVGTPAYMSPEQARGDAGELSAAADVFSLGCVLFECLTGRPAFAGKQIMAVLAKILLEEAPRVSELQSDVPKPLDELISRMLSKDPARRPADGAEVHAGLAALSQGQPHPAPRRKRPITLTEGEQRLLCVVLAATEPLSPGETEPPFAAQRQTLAASRNAVAPFGGLLEPLADGSFVVTLSGSGVATDQAQKAARCALALRKHMPCAPMGLATGRGQAGPWPAGEVIDRVARLVRAEQRGGSPREYPIRVDEVTAGLLGPRFLVGGDENGLQLQGERELFDVTRTLLGKAVPFVGREIELGHLETLFARASGDVNPSPAREKRRAHPGPASLVIPPPDFGDAPTRTFSFSPNEAPNAPSWETHTQKVAPPEKDKPSFTEAKTQKVLPYRPEEDERPFDPAATLPTLHRPQADARPFDPAATLPTAPRHSTPAKGASLAAPLPLEKVFDRMKPQARAALIIAPAGTGKSRLCHEFLQKQRKKDIEIFVGRGDPMRAGSPFALLAPAIRRAAGIWDGEPLAVRRQKLKARLSRHLLKEKADRVTCFLGELSGVPFPDEERLQLRAARQDPRLMGDQMLRAFEDWLLAECVAQPVILVLEDLQWGDLSTVQFIDTALRNLKSYPLFVLALSRPDVRELFPDLWQEHPLDLIYLDKLTRSASQTLCRDILGEAVSPETVARIIDRADGNAFYLEGLIRAVAEGKGEELPETVLAMVSARLERIPDEARRILRAASIFGRVFWERGVRQLLGEEKHPQIKEWLDWLVEEEIIAWRGERKFSGEEEYVFCHSLVRETAYTLLTDTDRSLGHRLAGLWLEETGEREALVLAEHFERGGDPARAIPWYKKAAEQALEGNDLSRALQSAERGLFCGAQGEAKGELRRLEAEVYNWRAEFALAERRGLEALRHLARQKTAWFRAASEVVLASGRLGHHEQLIALGRALQKTRWGEVIEPPHLIAPARAVPRLVHAGQLPLANALLARIEEVASQVSARDPVCAAWVQMARASQGMIVGDYASFLVWMEAAAASFERLGDRRNACLQKMDVGYAYFHVGAYTDTVTILKEVVFAARQLDLRRVTGAALLPIGPALAYLGDFEEAKETAEQTLRALLAQGDPEQIANARIQLATVYLLIGDLTGIERETCLLIETQEQSSRLRTHALGLLARLRLMEGQIGQALALTQEAVSFLRPIGGLDQGESLIRVVYAQALLASSQQQEARVAIEEARAALLTRASKISNARMRENFLSQVPDNALTLSLAQELCG